MCRLRYRPKDCDGTSEGQWLRWDDPTLSDDAFCVVWGADVEVAVEDDDEPNLLILLPTPRLSHAQAVNLLR